MKTAELPICIDLIGNSFFFLETVKNISQDRKSLHFLTIFGLHYILNHHDHIYLLPYRARRGLFYLW